MYATPGLLQQVGVGFDGAFGREHGLAQREGQFAARGIEVAAAVEESSHGGLFLRRVTPPKIDAT